MALHPCSTASSSARFISSRPIPSRRARSSTKREQTKKWFQWVQPSSPPTKPPGPDRAKRVNSLKLHDPAWASLKASKESRMSFFCSEVGWVSKVKVSFTASQTLPTLQYQIVKEVAGIYLLLTHSLFGGDIPHRFLRRAFLAKPTSAPLRF